MKTLAITFWTVGSVLVVAGAFFKIMHYSGSAMLMMIGLLASAAGLLVMFITGKKKAS